MKRGVGAGNNDEKDGQGGDVNEEKYRLRQVGGRQGGRPAGAGDANKEDGPGYDEDVVGHTRTISCLFWDNTLKKKQVSHTIF